MLKQQQQPVLVELMKRCWARDYRTRPFFPEVLQLLDGINREREELKRLNGPPLARQPADMASFDSGDGYEPLYKWKISFQL